MSYKRKQLPKYCLHKGLGQAYCRIAGDTHYLGKHGSDASRREYDRIMGEFIANGRQPFRHPDEITVSQLIIRYLDHVETELNVGKARKQGIALALRHLNEFWGKQPVSSFGPSILKSLRKQWLEGKLCLTVINGRVGIVKQMFHWGGEEEIIPADIANAVKLVKPLQKGQSTAVEYDAVEPVADEDVEKTLPYLTRQEQDMVMVQRRISGRPQDIYNMRPCDIDRSGDIWVYSPFTYKTKKKDAAKNKTRRLFIGPRAQAVLLPYLERCKDNLEQFVFKRQSGKQWVGSVYGKAIAAACKKAGVPTWTPNQLRHAGGTEVRNKFGLDHAQVALGHAKASTTEIYAKVDDEKALKVAREIG